MRVPALLCALVAALATPAIAEARPLDADRDGLSNRFEKRRSHTNPRKADTDRDGLRDKYELRRSHTSPRRKDTDRDGLSDGYELKRSKTSPRRKDTDGDGLSDGYEVRRSKTSPRDADGDGDGLRDGVEVFFGLDPRRTPDQGPDDPPLPPDLPDLPDPPSQPDSSAPNTSITAGPSGTVATRSASFSFSSSESGSTFQCRLDGGTWSGCSSPKGFSNLGEGTHTFAVRARDKAGNTDLSPAQRTWTIDLPAPPPPPDVTPPTTSITGGPTGTASSTSASFTFSSSEPGSTFQCRLDGGPWNGCASPKGLSGLGEGSHTFAVRAFDAAGNVDATPAARTWTVDFPPPSGAADVFVSTSGSDGNPCSSAAPCRSFGRAYAVAAAGDVVQVADGTYGDQAVPSGSKSVTFRGVSSPKLRTLDNSASNATYDGFDVDAGFAKVVGFHNDGDNATFKNGRIGNVTDDKGALISGSNFTFDNVVFHDVRLTNSQVHNECVYAIVVPGMTVRNSIFYACATMDLFFTYGTWWNPRPPAYGNITLENNVFGHATMIGAGSWHYYSLAVGYTGAVEQGGGTIANWVVRNNTFETPAAIGDKTASGTSRWVGNLGDWSCISGMTFRYNVGKKCHTTDRQVSPAGSSAGTPAPFGWVNPAGNDFHLAAGSPAIDAADPSDHPATDRDGKSRGSAPDAGAYER